MPRGRSSSRNGGGEHHQHARDEIREHDVEGPVAAGHAPLAHAEPPGERVPSCVRGARLDRDRIDVQPDGARRTELHRGDGQDPGAAPDVEDTGAGQPAAIGNGLDRGQAESRGRMQPGPERHPGIEREHDVAGRAAMTPPRRSDDEPPPDPHHREVGLPGVRPVGFQDDPRPQLPDRSQPERLEVAECHGDLGHGPVRGGPVARRQVRPDDGGPARIQARAQSLIHQLESRFHRGPARRRPAEDLADRLDRLDVRVDRELEPGPPAVGDDLAQPSPSFSSRPPPPCATVSPASSA